VVIKGEVMDNLDIVDVPQSMLASIIPEVGYKDAFFQDLRDAVEPIVRGSLFMYLAYLAKGEEAAKYRLDSEADIPLLSREATLRGIPVSAMVEMVEQKGAAFKAVISDLELLRIQFNLLYANTEEEVERLQLREEFVTKLRSMSIPS
jgi:hypothetical protein